jgi:hypothetical protein
VPCKTSNYCVPRNYIPLWHFHKHLPRSVQVAGHDKRIEQHLQRVGNVGADKGCRGAQFGSSLRDAGLEEERMELLRLGCRGAQERAGRERRDQRRVGVEGAAGAVESRIEARAASPVGQWGEQIRHSATQRLHHAATGACAYTGKAAMAPPRGGPWNYAPAACWPSFSSFYGSHRRLLAASCEEERSTADSARRGCRSRWGGGAIGVSGGRVERSPEGSDPSLARADRPIDRSTFQKLVTWKNDVPEKGC